MQETETPVLMWSLCSIEYSNKEANYLTTAIDVSVMSVVPRSGHCKDSQTVVP